MNHQTMLDEMLANACSNPADVPWMGDVNEYNFEAHCAEFTVWARRKRDVTDGVEYDVYQIRTIR